LIIAAALTTPTEVATVVEERVLAGLVEGLIVVESEGESSLAVLGSASAEDPLAVLGSSSAEVLLADLDPSEAEDPDMDALAVPDPASAEDPGPASSVDPAPTSDEGTSPKSAELADADPDKAGGGGVIPLVVLLLLPLTARISLSIYSFIYMYYSCKL
jgi:hypothetical protein